MKVTNRHLVITLALSLLGLVATAPRVSADANETATTSSNFPVQQSITGGQHHSCVVVSGGVVKCWGLNSTGQLGDGTITQRTAPVSVLTSGTAASNPITPLTDVVSISAGTSHTCAVKSDKTAWCWGYNFSGQLGDGTSGTNRLNPVQVLASGTATSDPITPLTDVVSISAGTNHTCAITNKNNVTEVWCWGANQAGQLGDGTVGTNLKQLNPVKVLASGTAVSYPVPFTDVVSISASAAESFSTCAITTTKGLWCWGDNVSGQLGDGTTTDRLNPIQVLASGTAERNPVPFTDVVAMSIGNNFTCAVKTDNTVWCWGLNQFSRLGTGVVYDNAVPATQKELNPVQVKGENGNGFLTGITAVTAGYGHACALSSDGNVWCWGYNNEGQIGNTIDGDTKSSTPLKVPSLSGVTALASGHWVTSAITADKIYNWGNDDQGQLGDGDPKEDSVTPVEPSSPDPLVPVQPTPTPDPDDEDSGDDSSGGDSGSGNNSGGNASGGNNSGGSSTNSTSTDPKPGDFSTIVDNKTVVTDVKSDEEGGVTIKGDGFSTTFESDTSGDNDAIFLPPSGNVVIRGKGMKPGSRVKVTLPNSNIVLGTTTVLSDGTFSAQFTVPRSLRRGNHAMTLQGTNSKGLALLIRTTATSETLKKTTVKLFRVYSTKMRPKLRRQTKRIVKLTPAITAAHCQGFVRPSKINNPKDIARAKKRAKAVCKTLKKRKKAIHTTIGYSASPLNRRRVEVSYR